MQIKLLMIGDSGECPGARCLSLSKGVTFAEALIPIQDGFNVPVYSWARLSGVGANPLEVRSLTRESAGTGIGESFRFGMGERAAVFLRYSWRWWFCGVQVWARPACFSATPTTPSPPPSSPPSASTSRSRISSWMGTPHYHSDRTKAPLELIRFGGLLIGLLFLQRDWKKDRGAALRCDL
jgi:hypothetical protein